MCIGIPMQVIDTEFGTARCSVDGRVERINILLIGEVEPGSYVLVHAGHALRTLEAEEAQLISDALRAVHSAASGAPFEHLIADLIHREPELPAHLRAGGLQ